MEITPNFNFTGNCEEVIRFYEKAFHTHAAFILHYSDADPADWHSELSETERNYVYHAEMKIGGVRCMFSDIIEFPVVSGNALFLTVTFATRAEVEAAYRMLEEGAEILVAPHSTTYSSCCTTLVDRYGIRWGLMTEQTER